MFFQRATLQHTNSTNIFKILMYVKIYLIITSHQYIGRELISDRFASTTSNCKLPPQSGGNLQLLVASRAPLRGRQSAKWKTLGAVALLLYGLRSISRFAVKYRENCRGCYRKADYKPLCFHFITSFHKSKAYLVKSTPYF